MPSLSSVFGAPASSLARSSNRSLRGADAPEQLRDSLRCIGYLLNDDVEHAEDELQKGDSAYHKLGLGVVSFMRATLGFEREIMQQASARLATAEAAASDANRKVQKTGQGFASDIYPKGTEYVLCHAEAQIMSAVVGILTESVTDAIKGFLKIRKAVFTLNSIGDMEEKFLREQAAGKQFRTVRESYDGTAERSNAPRSSNVFRRDEQFADPGDDDIMFANAEEDNSPAASTYHGLIETNGELEDRSGITRYPSAEPAIQDQVGSVQGLGRRPKDAKFIDSALLKNPTDLFIHSGYCMHRGMLLLMLSLVPPTFSRILSVVGFRGDREQGLSLLWEAARSSEERPAASDGYGNDNHSAINGAVAGLVLLGFYSGLVAILDILPANAIPKTRYENLLRTMRAKFPGSRLWRLEESRMHSGKRDIPTALQLLETADPSPLKQVEALRFFETGLLCAFTHRYQKCADSFLKCVKLNNWSHALYYYIAASAHVELYRIAAYSTSTPDPKAAEHHAAEAEKYYLLVPEHIGKKKLMGRQLPFDAFTARKVAKWQTRAKEWGVHLVEAVGVSPLEEINYLWGGFRKMSKTDMQESQRSLAWSDGDGRMDMRSSPCAAQEPPDEKGILAFLRAALYRQLGDTVSARTLLSRYIIDLPGASTHFRGGQKDNWIPPIARYEMACCCWREAGAAELVPDGDRIVEQSLAPEQEAKLKECARLLDEVAAWESYDLDGRFGIKVTTGRDTLRKLGIV